MKPAQALLGVIAMTLALSVTGCTAKSLREQHAAGLEQVHIGMTEAELKQALPTVARAGEKDGFERYELAGMEMGDAGIMHRKTIEFWFVNGKLERWGDPYDLARK